MYRSKKSSVSRMDGLESRKLFSGNVGVEFDGQLMNIRGDNLDNQITVNQNAAGVITVTGQTGTLINGLPSVRFANGLAIEKLDVLMEGGNDRVTIGGLRIAGDVNVDLGVNILGRDVAVVNNSTINGSLFMYGGLEDDTLNISNSTVGLDLILDLAEGLGRSNVNNTSVLGSATLIGGEGNDVFNSRGSNYGLELKVDTKQGNDTVNFSTGSAAIAAFSTDLGNDRVVVEGFTVAEDFVVETGDGNDNVTLTGVVSLKNLSVNLDSGIDRLQVSGTSVALDAVLVGGAGTDTLSDRGLTAGVKKEVVEFEIFA